jgi:hypothetical protein
MRPGLLRAIIRGVGANCFMFKVGRPKALDKAVTGYPCMALGLQLLCGPQKPPSHSSATFIKSLLEVPGLLFSVVRRLFGCDEGALAFVRSCVTLAIALMGGGRNSAEPGQARE